MPKIQQELQLIATIHKIVFAPIGKTFVKAGKEKIGQVINNIVSNAKKYSSRSSAIYRACVITGNGVQVSVEDGGMGIAPYNIDKLFDRYYRTGNAVASTIAGLVLAYIFLPK